MKPQVIVTDAGRRAQKAAEKQQELDRMLVQMTGADILKIVRMALSMQQQENGNSEEEKIYLINEAAKILKMSDRTLRRKAKAKTIPFHFDAGKYYFTAADLRAIRAQSANGRKENN